MAGSITSTSDTGASAAVPVSVPAGGQLVVATPATAGSWVSQAVALSGGGVAVSQLIHGPSGWAQSPCQSGTSQQWYFPSGTTAGSNNVYTALFNPTSTPDVVDLTFVTPSEVLHPISFQGIVLQPGQTQVENVGSYVQNQQAVATTVTTRTGRVVASETQVFSGSGAGLAIVPGSPHPESRWSIPQSQEVSMGSTSLDIFNPGSTTEAVTVSTRLASGPLPAFHAQVLPESTWTLATSAQTRIPKSGASTAGSYSTIVQASGGDGVVVGRSVVAPSGSPTPVGRAVQRGGHLERHLALTPVGGAVPGQCVGAGASGSGAERGRPFQSDRHHRDVLGLGDDTEGEPAPDPRTIASVDLHLAERAGPVGGGAQSAARQLQRLGGHRRERRPNGRVRRGDHARDPARRSLRRAERYRL